MVLLESAFPPRQAVEILCMPVEGFTFTANHTQYDKNSGNNYQALFYKPPFL